MSSTKRKLAVVPSSRPEDDPARLQLAAAIRAVAKAKATLAAHVQAIDRAREQTYASEREVEQARSGVDAAKTAFAGELADALARGAPLPATSAAVKSAEAAVVEAQRTAESTATARERLRADLRSCEIAVFLADNDVVAAVNAVIAPLAEQILEQGEAARRTLFRTAAVLNFLRAPDGDPRSDFFWKPGDDWKLSHDAGEKRRAPMAEINKEIERFLARFRQDIDTNAIETLQQWRAWREMLKRDANATPPGELDQAT
jgi:hypothetical protein